MVYDSREYLKSGFFDNQTIPGCPDWSEFWTFTVYRTQFDYMMSFDALRLINKQATPPRITFCNLSLLLHKSL